MEKRRCLGVSSCIGGESGLLGGSPADMAPLAEGGPSLGGVAGGAGTFWAAAGSAEDDAGAGRPGTADSDVKAGGCFGSGAEVCRRMSDSEAMTPRLRRNGIVAAVAGDHHRSRRGETNMAGCYSDLVSRGQDPIGWTGGPWNLGGEVLNQSTGVRVEYCDVRPKLDRRRWRKRLKRLGWNIHQCLRPQPTARRPQPNGPAACGAPRRERRRMFGGLCQLAAAGSGRVLPRSVLITRQQWAWG